MFVVTVSDVERLDQVRGTRRHALAAALKYQQWIGNYIAGILRADDFPAMHMASLLAGEGKESLIAPEVAPARLSDLTPAMTRELQSWFVSLKTGTLIVAHADLIRALGREVGETEMLYAVRIEDGLVSMIAPLRDEAACEELWSAMEEAGESAVPSR